VARPHWLRESEAATPAPIATSSLYTGPLFRARRAFAESDTRPWMIVSAFDRFVAPHESVLAYDYRAKLGISLENNFRKQKMAEERCRSVGVRGRRLAAL
jgi:hypothetical protein